MSAVVATDDADASETRLLGGRVTLFQPARGYRAAIDPVLLAAAVPGEVPARVPARWLELGCGTGAALVCFAARVPAVPVIGLEREAAAAGLARRSVAASGLDDRVTVIEGDLADPPAAIEPGGFGVVFANPPFLEAGRATAPPDAGRRAAHVEGEAGVAAWVDAAHRALAPRGRLVLIHRADRVDALLAALVPRFGAIEILPLWPRQGRDARRVVLRATKGARSPARLAAGLVLHDAAGRFTAEAEAVLRHAAPLG
ncbi:MAG: methyltransferase [Azospirillaceae bacterium]